MLSSDLLRTKINRGRIAPMFCSTNFGNGTDYELANKIITSFADAQKNSQTKGQLTEKITAIELQYDYKLVRGLSALLERRSIFQRTQLPNSTATPQTIRQRLFEESSKQGLALSLLQRQDIIKQIARQMHLQPQEIETAMWSDKEENLVLVQFDIISPKDLILWYNLSLAQTLLFKCTGLEFYIKGGIHWKRVLRDVKKYGLMYSLEHESDDGKKDGKGSSIRCVLDGALSLFKMTDRYGTSMAKLLPSIVSTPTWKISGSIVKKNENGQKIYEFEISSESTKDVIRKVVDVAYPDNDYRVYDSSDEAVFAKKFSQYFDQQDRFGWKISREPDPLIANGKAMIPDFLFERFGRKVYLEIVGFWTREYLDRKAVKLKALFGDGGNADQKNSSKVDLLVAVNTRLACSQIKSISHDRIFAFEKDVPIKPILEHLKKIDAQILKEKISNTVINLEEEKVIGEGEGEGEGEGNSDIISIKDIAEKYHIPEQAAVQIISTRYPDSYVVLKSHLIPKDKANTINDLMAEISEFVAACKVLTLQRIPDSCHAELLSKLGYDVIWMDLNPDNAKIVKATTSNST